MDFKKQGVHARININGGEVEIVIRDNKFSRTRYQVSQCKYHQYYQN